MDKQLQDKLRFFKLDLLSFLHVLATSDFIALELNEISASTHTSEADLRGVISTLRRMKINGASLILPAGRDESGRLRWKIDESVVSKKELAKFLEDEILGKQGISRS